MELKPCPHRQVDDEGHILCDKIKSGDRAVSPNTCRACPIAQINCAHLRATLDHQARPPLVVRYGNGKTQIWDDLAPPIALQRAACAAKVTPITSPRECAGCALRQPLGAATTADGRPFDSTQGKPQTAERRPLAVARRPPQPAPPMAATDARSNIVAQKIIKLQEWLANQKRGSQPDISDEETVMPIALGARPMRRPAEEKHVGWTD